MKINESFILQKMSNLLCADKNDAMVKFTLPENEKHILASKYELYIPNEKQLLVELKKEMEKH